MAKDNRTLGKFTLTGLPPAPRGVPQVEVAFDIDANGILNVTAKDMATNKQQAITITSSSGLSDEEIEQMVKDAEKHSEDDKKQKEVIENRNKLDQIIYALEKLQKENKDKIPQEMQDDIESAINAGKEAVKSGDDEKIKNEIENINELTAKLSTELYKNGAPQQPEGDETSGEPQSENPGNEGGQEAEEGEVIDAEFEDMDKK